MFFLDKKWLLLISVSAVLNLNACDPFTVGTTVGGVVGLTALEERTAETNLQDQQIHFTLHRELREQLPEKSFDLTILVYESEVMLVGYIREDLEAQVIGITENTPGIQRIESHFYNSPLSSASFVSDRLLGLEISAKLSFEKEVHAVNYVIRVYDRRVYIMGVALSSSELDQLYAVIESLGGVRGLISLARVRPPALAESPDSTALEQMTSS